MYYQKANNSNDYGDDDDIIFINFVIIWTFWKHLPRDIFSHVYLFWVAFVQVDIYANVPGDATFSTFAFLCLPLAVGV